MHDPIRNSSVHLATLMDSVLVDDKKLMSCEYDIKHFL